MKKCKNCSNVSPDSAKFCSNCGYRLDEDKTENEDETAVINELADGESVKEKSVSDPDSESKSESEAETESESEQEPKEDDVLYTVYPVYTTVTSKKYLIATILLMIPFVQRIIDLLNIDFSLNFSLIPVPGIGLIEDLTESIEWALYSLIPDFSGLMKIIEVVALIPIFVVIFELWSTRSKAFKFDYAGMADNSLTFLRGWLSFIFGLDIAIYVLAAIVAAIVSSGSRDGSAVIVPLVLLLVVVFTYVKFAAMRIALKTACDACRGIKADCISKVLPVIFIIEGVAKILSSQFQLISLCEAVAIFMFGLVLLDYRKYQLGYV